MGSVEHLTGTAPARLHELLAAAQQRLGAPARLDAEVLLAHVLQQPRSVLFADRERAATPAQATHYRALIERRAAGEPVAYLTGEREFWSLPLRVTPAVLIPRPETELVVERVLALLGESAAAASMRLLELGTGSGAIALALATARRAWSITAVERSEAALQVALQNAQRLGLTGVELLAGDWFSPLAQRRFDLICSNPPYVAAADAALAALRFEPAAALVAGATGLEALLWLIAAAPPHLERGGWLVLEHGASQADALAAALVASGYARVRCHRDLAGLDRVTEAQWES